MPPSRVHYCLNMTPMFSLIRVTLHWLDRPSGTTPVWNELEHKISSLRAFRSIAKGAGSVLNPKRFVSSEGGEGGRHFASAVEYASAPPLLGMTPLCMPCHLCTIASTRVELLRSSVQRWVIPSGRRSRGCFIQFVTSCLHRPV